MFCVQRKLNKRLDDKFHSLEVDSDEEKQTEQTDKKTDRKIVSI